MGSPLQPHHHEWLRPCALWDGLLHLLIPGPSLPCSICSRAPFECLL